jgi:hypothetical protein
MRVWGTHERSPIKLNACDRTELDVVANWMPTTFLQVLFSRPSPDFF